MSHSTAALHRDHPRDSEGACEQTDREFWLQDLAGVSDSPEPSLEGGSSMNADRRTRRLAIAAPFYGPPRCPPCTPISEHLPPPAKPSAVVDLTNRDEPAHPSIKVGIVDPCPYYGEAVALALRPDHGFRSVNCFLTPDYIPASFDGVIVLTVRDQEALDGGLVVTAARLPKSPVVVVNPAGRRMQYLSLIAYPGIALRLQNLGIEALKRAIVNAETVAASASVRRLR